MLILLYIFLGLLFFDCLTACCLSFWKKNRSKQYEEQLNNLKTVESTEYGKNAKGNRSPDFVHQSEVLPFQT